MYISYFFFIFGYQGYKHLFIGLQKAGQFFVLCVIIGKVIIFSLE